MFTVIKEIYLKEDRIPSWVDTLVKSCGSRSFRIDRICVHTEPKKICVIFDAGAALDDDVPICTVGESLDLSIMTEKDDIDHIDLCIRTDIGTLFQELSRLGFKQNEYGDFITTYPLLNTDEQNEWLSQVHSFISINADHAKVKNFTVKFSYREYMDPHTTTFVEKMDALSKEFKLYKHWIDLETMEFEEFQKYLICLNQILLEYDGAIHCADAKAKRCTVEEHNIDEMIYPLIQTFNEKGYQTLYSCQGHSNDEWPYIDIIGEHDFFDLPEGWYVKSCEFDSIGTCTKLYYDPIEKVEDFYDGYATRLDAIMNLHEYLQEGGESE